MAFVGKRWSQNKLAWWKKKEKMCKTAALGENLCFVVTTHRTEATYHVPSVGLWLYFCRQPEVEEVTRDPLAVKVTSISEDWKKQFRKTAGDRHRHGPVSSHEPLNKHKRLIGVKGYGRLVPAWTKSYCYCLTLLRVLKSVLQCKSLLRKQQQRSFSCDLRVAPHVGPLASRATSCGPDIWSRDL